MKKILLSLTAALFGFTLYAGQIDTAESIFAQEINLQDYCPNGYVCIATNVQASAQEYYLEVRTITGISVYQNNNGDYIAYVPGHGHLRLTKGSRNGVYYWIFYANNGSYKIYNLPIN